MAGGAERRQERPSISRRSLKDAHEEASRLIEGNEKAQAARKALIKAGIDEQYLEVMFYYWHIQERIKAEPAALAAAREAPDHALWLTDWVEGLIRDMPAIFHMVRRPPRLKSDDPRCGAGPRAPGGQDAL